MWLCCVYLLWWFSWGFKNRQTWCLCVTVLYTAVLSRVNIPVFKSREPSYKLFLLSLTFQGYFLFKGYCKIRVHYLKAVEFIKNSQCKKIPIKWPLLKMCERSELVDISQLFWSFFQTRHLTVELSQPKPKKDWKTSKMTRQFWIEKRSKNGKILHDPQNRVCYHSSLRGRGKNLV